MGLPGLESLHGPILLEGEERISLDELQERVKDKRVAAIEHGWGFEWTIRFDDGTACELDIDYYVHPDDGLCVQGADVTWQEPKGASER